MHLRLGRERVDVAYRPLVVGILNRTRDSFYDGGAHFGLDALLKRADQLVADGADLLEVGARPGGVDAQDVGVEEETDLVADALDALSGRFDIPLPVDTSRATVVTEAFRQGACWATT